MHDVKFRNVALGASMFLQAMLAFGQEGESGPASLNRTLVNLDYTTVFPAMLLGLAVLAVVFVLVARRNKARYETIKLLIEKGQQVPPEFYAPHRPPMPGNRPYTLAELMGYAIGWGVTWTCLGLGVGAANYFSSGELRSAAWGLVFVFLGLGSFINAAIIRWQIAKQGATFYKP